MRLLFLAAFLHSASQAYAASSLIESASTDRPGGLDGAPPSESQATSTTEPGATTTASGWIFDGFSGAHRIFNNTDSNSHNIILHNTTAISSIALLKSISGTDRPIIEGVTVEGISAARNIDSLALLRKRDGAVSATGQLGGVCTIVIVPEDIAELDEPPMAIYLRARDVDGSDILSPLFGLVKEEDYQKAIDENTAATVFGSTDALDQMTDDVAFEDKDENPLDGFSGASSTISGGLSSATDTSQPDQPSDSETSKEDSKDGGLAVGAIVGIAIGAFAAVVLILGLIWFFMRRRKRANANKMSVHPDASTPLAGYPNAAARSGEFMGEKDAGAMAIAESPRSAQMYSDHQPDQLHRSSQGPSTLGTAAVGGAGAASSRYNDGYDAGSSPPPPSAAAVASGGHATPPPGPREESGSRADMNSPVPSTTVARHLVDPNMTEDEIRRLEEEERELDRQIQEAGRRK